MALGLGHLQFPPAVFWIMTPRELFAAADGYLRRMGVDPEDTREPLTKDDVRRMAEEYEAEQAAKAARQETESHGH